MPTFATPEPISVQIELPVGNAYIAAGERTDTVVEVRPRNPSSKSDVTMAEQTQVEYTAGRLTVRAPRSWRRYAWFGSGPTIDLVISLPAGSAVQADADWATFRTDGRLGECRFQTSGAIRIDETAALEVDSSYGDVTVQRVGGDARITCSHGQIRVREVTGATEIKSSSGECWLGETTGEVRVKSAHGGITVEKAGSGVSARTASGTIRIGRATRGVLDLQTSYGAIEVGVRTGTATWLDVGSEHGRVHNALAEATGPVETDETLEVRASSSYGDIIIRRS